MGGALQFLQRHHDVQYMTAVSNLFQRTALQSVKASAHYKPCPSACQRCHLVVSCLTSYKADWAPRVKTFASSIRNLQLQYRTQSAVCVKPHAVS